MKGLALAVSALLLTGCTVLEAPPEKQAERAALTATSVPATSLAGARQWILAAEEKLAPVLAAATQPPSQVLALDPEAPLPTEVLSRRLNTVLGSELSTAALVTDVMTGEVLYDRDATTARTPASSLKILTAAAALYELGPQHRYTTRAVLVSEEPLTVALVAGGDALLGEGANDDDVDGRAGLGSLAAQTIDALDGRTGDLRIVLDDGGYSGPQLTWNDTLVESGNISPVQPLALHGARDNGERVADPGAHAVSVFRDQVAQLAADTGLDVEQDTERDATAGLGERDGEELGAVDSATVAEQVEYLLVHSDNQVAEVTARNAALASGRAGSFEGVAGLLTAVVDTLGVDARGITIADGSGLSAANRISAAQLVGVMNAVQHRPWLAEAVLGLPTAGLEGTLAERMTGTSAAGTVRAKTGTLSRHSSLTGTVVTAEGRQLWFSVLNTGPEGETVAEARELQDRVAVTLADCGC